MRTLHQLTDIARHVVTQVVEAELIICTVRNICQIGLAALFRVGFVLVDAIHGQSMKFIQQSHPLGVTFGQVVVHGNHMHAFAWQGVEVNGQCSHKGFTFTRCHLGNLALMQHRTADELNLVVAHVPLDDVATGRPAIVVASLVAHNLDTVAISGNVAIHLRGGHFHHLIILEAAGSLLHHRECLRQNLVKHFLRLVVRFFLQVFQFLIQILLLGHIHIVVCLQIRLDFSDSIFLLFDGIVNQLSELLGLSTQFIIRQRFNRLVCFQNTVLDRLQFLHITRSLCTEQFAQEICHKYYIILKN